MAAQLAPDQYSQPYPDFLRCSYSESAHMQIFYRLMRPRPHVVSIEQQAVDVPVDQLDRIISAPDVNIERAIEGIREHRLPRQRRQRVASLPHVDGFAVQGRPSGPRRSPASCELSGHQILQPRIFRHRRQLDRPPRRMADATDRRGARGRGHDAHRGKARWLFFIFRFRWRPDLAA
jgi:hypothetical protein